MDDLRLLNMEEVMSTLGGIGRTTLYRLVNTKALPAKKVGKRTMFSNKDVMDYINNLDNYEGGPNGF
ncbi:helix-turn-helix domain-containing protein [Candidatus Saccharibacteria bacterium]|nr:helix-turn-helix domain-containing protein [Candidatus Saccharibacteria bacterium]